MFKFNNIVRLNSTFGRSQKRQFNPLQYSPALWLDASDQSTLTMDGAASFASASSQYLSVANNATISPATGLMVGCWVNLSTLPGTDQNSRLISRWLVTGSQRSYDLTLTDISGLKRFKFYGSTNGTTVIEATSGQVPSTSTWYFVVGWWNGSNLYCSVNGGTPGSAALASMFDGAGALWLGAREGGADYLNGVMDSAFILKTPTALGDGMAGSLAKSLIDYLYNGGAGRRSSDFINSSLYSGSGAVSWWDLDEASGTRKDRIGTNDLTASASSPTYASGIASGNVQYDGDPIKQWSDKSGNGRHVTAPSDAARSTYKTGVQNGKSCVRVDGVDDLFEVANASWFIALSSITVFSVVRTEIAAAADTQTMFRSVYMYDTGLNYSYSLISSLTSGVYSGEKLSPIFGDWGPSVRTGVSTYTRNADQAQILSLTASTTGTKIYANAVELTIDKLNAFTTTTASGPSITGMTSPKMEVCRSGSTSKYTDSLELIIYPSVLSTSQRQQVERYLAEKWMSPPVVTLTASSTVQHLEWNAVDMATGYEVYYKLSSSNSWVLYTTTTSLWAVVQDLAVGSTYDYRVDAIWSV